MEYIANIPTDEGLQETGKSMSQIPTYVTAVPNGTEKVDPFHELAERYRSTHKSRASTSLSTLAAPTSASAPSVSMAILPSPLLNLKSPSPVPS